MAKSEMGEKIAVKHLESKFFWLGLKGVSQSFKPKEEPDILGPTTHSLLKSRLTKYTNWQNHWIGEFIKIIAIQKKFATLVQAYAENHELSSEALLSRIEEFEGDDTKFRRWRIDAQIHRKCEQALATLAGFGPTKEHVERYKTQVGQDQLWDLWLDNAWPTWRTGTWVEFGEAYWTALEAGDLYFPETLNVPELHIQPLQDSGASDANGQPSNPDAPPIIDTPSPIPWYRANPAWPIAGAALLICAIILLSQATIFTTIPSKKTGDCVPGFGPIMLSQPGKETSEALSVPCSPSGEFNLPKAEGLATLSANQMFPKGLVDQTRAEPLAIMPVDPTELAELPAPNLHHFGPPLSATGMLHARRSVQLDLTCPSGLGAEITHIAIRQAGDSVITHCRPTGEGPSTAPFQLQGLDEKPVTIIYRQQEKDILTCTLPVSVSLSDPVDSIKEGQCKPDTSRSTLQSNPIIATLDVPLRPFYSGIDTYFEAATGLIWMRDLHRYTTYRYWGGDAKPSALSDLLHVVWADTGNKNWRMATRKEVKNLLANLEQTYRPRDIAGLLKGRLGFKARYLLMGLVQDETCKPARFGRIGRSGSWPLQTTRLDRQPIGNPCVIPDKDIGFWLVRE